VIELKFSQRLTHESEHTMASGPGPDQSLAERLRLLRQTGLSRLLTQREVAVALGRDKPLSLALISSWETGKALPPDERLRDLARLYAPGSARDAPALLDDGRLGTAGREARERLERELFELRDQAEAAPEHRAGARSQPAAGPADGIWHFPDGNEVCIIASQLPDYVLTSVEYADYRHPNHINMLHFADADALVEVFGHLRASNPASKVTFKTWEDMVPDDWSKHVVVLGGDWNMAAQWYRRRVDLPVEFVDPSTESDFDGFFRITVLDPPRDFAPLFTPSPADLPQLEYDVGLFARSPNPANPDTTLTLCQGLFSRGTFGLVRMFTDAQHREANEAMLEELDPDFGTDRLEWLLVRVPVALGSTVTPNLSRPYLRLAIGSRSEATLLEGALEGAVPEI
jgi:transcriptional regulator with XRE-family HTH domain